MIRRISLAAIVASLLAVGLAYASAFAPGGAPRWAPWLMAMGTTLLMVATTALGAVRGGRLGRVWIPLAVFLLVVGGAYACVLAMPPGEAAGAPLWLGLPHRAAVLLFGVGLLPLFGVPVGYALTFDENTLSGADLARVREAKRAAAAAREDG
jgi:hypothetical protein